LQIFFEDLSVSFTNESDIFPDGRQKLIHTQGVIAKAKWVKDGQAGDKYTGIFKGCQNFLIRLSIAKQPDTSKTRPEQAKGNFVPGMAFKCLRTGVPSANLQAMFSVVGQPSWNFFKNDFTHDFPFPNMEDVDFAGKSLASKFAGVTKWIGTIGLKTLSEWDENGNHESTPTYPFRIIFKPNPNVQSKFSDDFKTYFRSA